MRQAVAQVFDEVLPDVKTQQIEQWFNLGGSIRLDDALPALGPRLRAHHRAPRGDGDVGDGRADGAPPRPGAGDPTVGGPPKMSGSQTHS
jgi:hypothetical protein